jgi:BMFP domain-containing protein YqiC
MSRLTGRTASLKKSAKSEHIISEREVFLHMKPKNKPQSSEPKESVADTAAKIFGKKMPEPTPGQIATQNRDISAEIIDVLRSIDFDHGRLKELVDEEEYRTMIKVRDVAVRMLGENPGIFDEVAQIGLDVCYVAKAWKEAVEDGMPSKARYAKRAVACGASTFWSSIPEDKEDERAAVLKNREEYFANFKMAIQTGEKIDNLEKELAGPEAQTDALCEVKKAALADARSQLSELEQALRENPDQAKRDSTPEVDVQPFAPGEQYYRAIRRMAELMDELPQSREAKELLIRILEEKHKK